MKFKCKNKIYIIILSVICLFFTACNSNVDVSKEKNVENKSVETVYSGDKYNINNLDDKDIILKCPKTGQSGKTIVIKTNIFMDVIPKIYINGEDIGSWNKNRTEYSFVMPDENVEVTTKLKNATN